MYIENFDARYCPFGDDDLLMDYEIDREIMLIGAKQPLALLRGALELSSDVGPYGVRWIRRGTGPKYVDGFNGREVRLYRWSDVKAWLRTRGIRWVSWTMRPRETCRKDRS